MINSKANSNWLLENKRINGEAAAVTLEEKSYSYSELSKLVGRTAQSLVNKGLSKDDHIALVLESSLEFVVSLFAIWNCGAVAVPLSPFLTDEELTDKIEFTDSKFVVTDNEHGSKLHRRTEATIIYTIEADSDIIHESPDRPNYDPGNPAVIMFTSGSSGIKKAAILSFDNLYSSCKNTDSIFNFAPGEKWLGSLPFYHIGGLQIIIRAILSNGELLIPEKINTQNILEIITKMKPHYISVVNSSLQKMIEQQTILACHTKAVFAGGGPISNDLVNEANKLNIPLYKVYGSTETASMVTVLPPEDAPAKKESSGKPLGDVTIKLFSDELEEVPAGAAGEIAIKSSSLISSYFKNDQLNKEKFHDGFFLTGDRGYLDADGYLYVLGRKDNFIITGGEKVDPAEVKQKMMKLGYFDDVHVLGLEDEKWGQIVCAAYLLSGNKKVTEEKIKEDLKLKLPPFKIPKKVLAMKEFPKTSIGKIDTLTLTNLLK